MIRLASSPTPHFRNLVDTALTMLRSESFRRVSMRHDPEASTAAIDMPRACAKVDDVDTTPTTPPAHVQLSGQPSHIDIEDWDDLYRAVEARLKETVGERLALAPEPQATRDTAGRVQVIVLECVAALDQLHTSLTLERSRRYQLELELLAAKTALAQALAELVATPSSSPADLSRIASAQEVGDADRTRMS